MNRSKLFPISSVAVLCGVLSTVSAQDGLFERWGSIQSNLLGTSVGMAGDVNLDGFMDVISGGPSNGYWTNLGEVIVLSGRDGSLIHRVSGDGSTDLFGVAVDGVGDVDGDAYVDFVVGAMADDNNGLKSGMVRVYSGRTGKVLYERDGDASGDYLGVSVSGVGDVNQDGYDDFVAGASINLSQGQKGYARVYSGKDGSTLYTFRGDSNFDQLGGAVSGAGDVDNDGVPDIVVGIPKDDNTGSNSGSVRVYSGRTGAILYTLDGDSRGDEFGKSVSGAGDVDKDGYADVLVGAWKTDNNGVDAGSVRVYSGRTGSALYTVHGDSAKDTFGNAVSGAGDTNKDGYPDFIVGAALGTPQGGSKTGYVRVLSGKDGAVLWTLAGANAGDQFGNAVAGRQAHHRGGDVNCDGFADLVVGLPEHSSPTFNKQGAMKVLSGRKLPLSFDPSWLELTAPGTQTLTLDAGATHPFHNYWIFGSITGTKPGIALNGVRIPLNYDPYTELAMGMPAPIYVGFRGTLDVTGKATASFNIPAGLPNSVPAMTLFHAYVTYGPQGITFASNAAPLRLVR
jgi:hypothetical protein